MARPIINLTGQKFGRLTVFRLDDFQTVGGHARWMCICDCGTFKVTESSRLRKGDVKSCGCLSREVGQRNRAACTKHGMINSPEYTAWSNMQNRCFKKNQKAWPNYGGRGITVCEEWVNDFTAFFDYVGLRPSSKHSLDRIDNDGNYEPGNVRWATRSVQNANKRSRTRSHDS